MLAGAATTSCAQTAREAARHATPAAVEGAVEEAEDPATRVNVSKILADSRIRNASAQLAESVTAGAVEGLTRDEQIARLEELGSRLVREFTATMTQTALTEMANAQFEQRLESAVHSATAGAMRGVGEAAREQGPEFLSFAGAVAREAGRNAALGMDEAVRQRQLDAETGRTNDEGVLVGMGETAEATVHGLPLVFAALFGVAILALIVLTWMLVRLRRRVHLLSQHHREGSRS